MDKTEMTELLKKVADGIVSPEEAALKLKMQPFMEIGEFAKVDVHRGIRQGVPEVIYGEGKTKEHILSIARAMLENGQKTALVTRMNKEAADYVGAQLPLEYNPMSRTGIIGERPEPTGKGRIVVATGGTSDIPVAEEAAVTAEVLGTYEKDFYAGEAALTKNKFGKGGQGRGVLHCGPYRQRYAFCPVRRND